MAGLDRTELLALRLASQRLPTEGDPTGFKRADRAVTWAGAVQAQEYAHARWAIGVRSSAQAHLTDAAVEAAIAKRTVVRTWALRGTLHLVAATDVRWLVALAAPALLTRTAAAYRREGLDDKALGKILPAIRKLLQGGQQLTRIDLLAGLERMKLDTQGHRGGLILYRAAQTGLICLGLPQGRQSTYTLLHEWLPGDTGKVTPRATALKTLALRYFSSHGPAAFADFLWWSGLAVAEARSALDAAMPSIEQGVYGETTVWWLKDTVPVNRPATSVHLLPGFDEYLLGYTGRDPVINPEHTSHAMTPNGLFRPTLLVRGRVAGIWQAAIGKGAVNLTVTPFMPLQRAAKGGLQQAAEHYAAFAGLPLGALTLA